MAVTSEHGRRGAEGEFPFGENTAYADLGRRIRTYSIRGRFPTNDHVQRADALIAACESPGPGALLHPTRGIVTVACRSLRVSDDPMEEQGVTYIDMDFVEANPWGNGFNFGGLLQAGLSLAPLVAAAAGAFNARYRPDDARNYNRAQVLDAASTAILQIRDEYASAAVRGADTDPNTWSAIFDLERSATDATVLNDAAATFRVIRLGMSALSASTSGQGKYDAFLRLANENALTSALAGIDGVSQDTVYSIMRILSAGYMTRAALENSSINADAAFREFEQISSILETEIQEAREACDNVLFLELRNFYTSAQMSLLNRVYRLPALVVYNFGSSVHSLVAAYEIYNDAKRFRDIEHQNPAALPWLLGPRVVAART